MEKKGRLATWTATVPIKITFAADERLDGDEVFEAAIKEIHKRTEDGNVESGYFDILWEEVAIVEKEIHRTRAEILEEKRQWLEFTGGAKL